MQITTLGPDSKNKYTMCLHDVPGVFAIRVGGFTIFYLKSDPANNFMLHKNFIANHIMFAQEHLNMFWGWCANNADGYDKFYGYRGKFYTNLAKNPLEHITEQFEIIETVYQENTRK